MQKYDDNKLFYKQNGFCVVRSFLEPAELKNIDQKVKKFILEKSNKLKGKNINFTYSFNSTCSSCKCPVFSIIVNTFFQYSKSYT